MLYDTHAPEPKVKVNGAPLPEVVATNLGQVVVEAQRNLPAMCEVTFNDEDSMLMDNPLMRPAATLSVEMPSASTDPTVTSLGPLFDGEVVAVEVSFRPGGGRQLLLRAYDKSHRLHRTRRTRTFLMKPDNAIAAEIAADAGLMPRTEPTGGGHEYLCQRNQTDWEFLSERARENGFELQVSRGQLVFRKAGPDPMAGLSQTLTMGDDLLSFRARATSAEQPKTTMVKSWNTTLKQPVVGRATPPSPENKPKDPQLWPATVALRFGGSEDVRTDLPLDMPPAAMGHARARRNHTSTAAFEAEGRCVGNPALRPGGKVDVAEVGKTFSGTYTVSSVRHVVDSSGYYTSFTVSGLHDRSLLGLTRPGAATGADRHGAKSEFDGAVVAKVSNSSDPQMLGRVKVEMPWLGDQAESTWAPVVSAGGGSGKGWQVIPEVGDSVLVVFEHGDARRPYVLGGLYNRKDALPSGPTPPPVKNGQTDIRMFRTRAGHELTFDDTSGAEKVTLTTKGGAKVSVVDSPTETIELADKSGQNKVTIDGAGKKVVLEAATNIELKARGMVKIEGQGGVELKSTATVKLEGTAGLQLKSTATTSIEGTMTTVKSNGPLNLQGTPMKLN